MTDETLHRIEEFAFSFPTDLSHGEDHVRRVTKNALKIAANYPDINIDALYCACILHDCGRIEQINDPCVPHARAGAEKAFKFLSKNGFEGEFAEFVSRIIAAHSSPDEAEQTGLEAKILFDADKLEMTGAVGISRALMYAISADEKLYEANKRNFSDELLNDMNFAQSHFFTPEARLLSQNRLKLMNEFYLSLLSEVN